MKKLYPQSKMEMKKLKKKKEKTCTIKTTGQRRYLKEMMGKEVQGLLVEENCQTSQVMQVHKKQEEMGVTQPDPDPQPQPGTSGYSKPRQHPPTQSVNR